MLFKLKSKIIDYRAIYHNKVIISISANTPYVFKYIGDGIYQAYEEDGKLVNPDIKSDRVTQMIGEGKWKIRLENDKG